MNRRPDETWDAAEERAARDADKWYDARVDRPFFATDNQPLTTDKPMGMMKDYLLQLQEGISEHQFGQDAVAWAISTGLVRLSYHKQRDLANLVESYDSIIDNYRAARQSVSPLLEVTMQFAQAAGLPITEIASGEIKEAA